MILEIAIALVLQQYPDVKCGPYLCGAYDTCERVIDKAPDDVRAACEIVLEGEE